MRRQDKEETWRCYLQTIPLAPRRELIQINSRGDASSIVLRHGFNVNRKAAMSYKTIISQVDNSRRCAERTELAIRIATDFDAHLIGLYASYRPTLETYSMYGIPPVVFEQHQHFYVERLEQARQAFEDTARRAGVKFEWRAPDGLPTEFAPLHARYADLAIVGQVDPDDPDTFVAERFPEIMALTVGKPVLILPYAGKLTPFGKHVLVGWNATREAARAMADAMPFLARAETVSLMVVNPKPGISGHGKFPGADVATLLARHGLKVEVERSDGIQIGIGEWMLSWAAEHEIDLIVMGAYGHPRLYEMILGGATRTVLESMTVPVLMSH
ncbi:MAG TPA: universal stress protein [Gammaproteobacteria bacterium]|nr:universal stress protein [Gammaproteobacteria bacterium]